ncbi:MAG: response regulator transcription factor [Arachnia sp.]
MTAVKGFVADDDQFIREQLVKYLRDDGIDVVGEAENGREAVERIRELAPDVALMDVRMPVLDGITATTELLAEASPTRFVIISSFMDDGVAEQAIAIGAAGVLRKELAPHTIAAAVRAAGCGLFVWTADNALPRAREIFRLRAIAAELEERDLKVLAGVARGVGIGELGLRLHYSQSAIKVAIRRLQTRFGVAGRIELAAIGQRLGLDA